MAKVRCQVKDLGVIFKADAKAAGQHVKLGGWECRGGLPPSCARWFAVELTKQTAPWAYSRGEPFRSIAALELFATLLAVMVFGGDWMHEKKGFVSIAGLTDNGATPLFFRS